MLSSRWVLRLVVVASLVAAAFAVTQQRVQRLAETLPPAVPSDLCGALRGPAQLNALIENTSVPASTTCSSWAP